MKKYDLNFSLIIIINLFLFAIILQFYRSLNWSGDTWQISEWLINYQGGFIRRGLPGEIIFWIYKNTNIQANTIAIFISGIFFLFLIILFLRINNRRIPLVLIFSSLLLGSPAYESFIIRKDVLGLVLLFLCLLFLKEENKYKYKIIGVNIIGSIAILSHEVFFFYGFPAIILIHYISRSSNIFKSIGIFLPILCAFIICSLFKGDYESAHIINESLSKVWRNIGDGNCCQHPSAAIDALQWSTEKSIQMCLNTFTNFSRGIYTPVAWILTIYFCFIYLLKFIPSKKYFNNTENNERDKSMLFFLLSIQLFFISPLFFLGVDYGRWIFLWTASSTLIYLVGCKLHSSSILANKLLMRINLQELASRLYFPWEPKQWHLLFFGIPSGGWSVINFLGATPFGYFFQYLFHRFPYLKDAINY